MHYYSGAPTHFYSGVDSRSRYIGLAKTGLQQACTAVAMNV